MAQPLAERLRPKTLDDYIGQKHLVGPGGCLAQDDRRGTHLLLYPLGASGVGKTTLAQIIATSWKLLFIH